VELLDDTADRGDVGCAEGHLQRDLLQRKLRLLEDLRHDPGVGNRTAQRVAFGAELGDRAAIGFGPFDLDRRAGRDDLALERAEEGLVEDLDPVEDRRVAAGDGELQELLRQRPVEAGQRRQSRGGGRAHELPAIHLAVPPPGRGFSALRDGA
jgi:hypothetical protein